MKRTVLFISLSLLLVLSSVLIYLPPGMVKADTGDTSLDAEQYDDIDNTLVPALAPWDWEMVEDPYQIRVREDFTAGQVLTFRRQDSYVNLQPMALEWTNDYEQVQQISMPADVTPVITNPGDMGTITWPDAYGSNIDFEWQSTPSRLNKTLTVSSLNDLPELEQFIIDGDNPVLRLNLIFAPSSDMAIYTDGVLWNEKDRAQTFENVEFRKDDVILWSFAPLMYWDSDGNEGQSIATLDKRGGSLYISIQVPYAWLETAVYPVYIDADVTIDAALYTSFDSCAIRAGPFWTDNVTGYVVYVDAGQDLVYKKTADGGATWDVAHTDIIAPGSCRATAFDCYADWQTDGDAGTKIHIAFISEDDENIRYTYLDTSDNSVGGDDIIEACQGTGILGSLNAKDNTLISITKTRGGNFAVAFKYKDSDNTGFNGFYTSPDADTWTSKTTPYEAHADYCILFPANLADADDLWGVYWDVSADEISLKTFDDDGDSWGEALISGSMAESTAYLQMDGAIRFSDGHLLLAAWSQYDNAASDLMTWDITDGGTITAKTNIITNTAEYFLCSVFINQDNDDVYVAYVGGTAAGSLVKCFYQLSQDGGATWDGQTAMQADAEDDERWVSCGAVKDTWGGKFLPVWFDDDDNDLFCNTDNGIVINTGGGPGIVPPTVDTLAATNTEETTSTLSGNITATGGENATARGFFWDTDNVSRDNNWYETGNFSVGDWSHGITGLTKGELYYFIATANNTAGAGSGDALTFLTKPDEPTSLADFARNTANISLTWTKGAGANTTMLRYRTDIYPTGVTDGTMSYNGTAETSNMTGLSPGQVYYIRGWSLAVEGGLAQFSDATADLTAYTNPDNPANLATSNILATSVDLEWTLGTGGDYTMVRRSTVGYPTGVADGDQAYYSTSNTTTDSGLDKGTLFYYRAWSRDSDSNYYSDGYTSANATTLTTAPTVTNSGGATDITAISALLNGELTDDGGETTEVHIYWGLTDGTDNVTLWDTDIDLGNLGEGVFSQAVSGLTEGITYYYRCSANNTQGTDWANTTESFITTEPEAEAAEAADTTQGYVIIAEVLLTGGMLLWASWRRDDLYPPIIASAVCLLVGLGWFDYYSSLNVAFMGLGITLIFLGGFIFLHLIHELFMKRAADRGDHG